MKKREKKSKKKWIVLLAALAVCGVIFAYFATLKIDVIKYEGNVRVSDETLTSYFFDEKVNYNPIIFKLKEMFGDKKDIPFVQDYEIDMKSFSSVTITIYEKSPVGYIYYMGTYMYFDKDGIVVENSVSGYEDVPEITGIEFDDIVLHSKIPVDSDKIFDIILNVTQLISKYNIDVKQINISGNSKVVLYIGNYRVNLGDDGNFSNKIATLVSIIPEMKDIPGELDMSEYDDTGAGYVFKKD